MREKGIWGLIFCFVSCIHSFPLHYRTVWVNMKIQLITNFKPITTRLSNNLILSHITSYRLWLLLDNSYQLSPNNPTENKKIGPLSLLIQLDNHSPLMIAYSLCISRILNAIHRDLPHLQNHYISFPLKTKLVLKIQVRKLVFLSLITQK